MIVLSTTSSFGEESSDVIQMLEEKGLKFVPNPFQRTLTEDDAVDLIREHQPVALLAGTGPLKEKALKAAQPHLKVVSRIGVGVDNVDLELAAKLGIKVFRTPESVTQPVVELTVGLILDLSRKISMHDRLIRSGTWKKSIGQLVSGKVLGICGCGRIGKGVALIMKALGCDVQAYDPYPDRRWHEEHGIRLVSDIPTLFTTSDLVSIHAEYSPDLKAFVNEALLSQCKPALLLVNTARGSMVDEEALARALRERRVAGAALDVLEKESCTGALSELDNIILTPHIGSYTRESRVRMETEAVTNLIRGLEI